MRETINYEERECDKCHKKAKFYPDTYGNSPFAGWLSVERWTIPSMRDMRGKGPWDFCSYTCAVEYLAMKAKEECPSLGLKTHTDDQEGINKSMKGFQEGIKNLAKKMRKEWKGERGERGLDETM